MTRIPPPTDSLWAKTYANDTATSRAAATSAKRFAGTQAAMVLECIAAAGDTGRTNSEIVEETGFMLASVCARVAALREDGLIRDSGLKRPTPSGCAAKVWVAVWGEA